MQPATRRRGIIRNGVVPGSVWESRMKMDEVRGGIKVFNAAGESRDDEEGLRVYRRLRRNQSDVVDAEKRKRRIWKQPEKVSAGGGSKKSPIELRKARSVGVEEKGVLLLCDGRENEEEMEEDDEIETDVEEKRKSFDDKEMNLPAEKEKEVEKVRKVERALEIPMSPQSPSTAVIQKKAEQVLDLRKKDQDPVSLPQGDEKEDMLFESLSESQHRMQHIVDLVMWKDISKSAFVFGFGAFFLISSSYAKDLNFSFISAISYLGLLYLAVIFLLRSILRRGEAVEFHEGRENLLGEEEAIWILRRVLPYANELLIRTRALFSGEPATTMKMAVLLFVMARCGNSVTIWSLAKMAFFGVFTIPKILSSYSVPLTRHGKFWLARFRDGWESCTHKKAVAAAVFTLIWNLSSTTARIWAVFMLVVVVRLYQQCMVVEWDGEEVAAEQHSEQQPQQQQQRQVNRPGWLSQGPRNRQVKGTVKLGLDVKGRK